MIRIAILFLSTLTLTASSLPDVRIATQNGRQVSLNDWRGKIVVVNFWATWCNACRSEIAALDRLQGENQDRVKVLGIALDAQGWRTVTPFLKQHGIRFDVGLAGPHLDAAFGKKLANVPVPLTLVFDEEGRLIARFTEAVGEQEIARLLR